MTSTVAMFGARVDVVRAASEQGGGRPAPALSSVKALVFDVFGTVVASRRDTAAARFASTAMYRHSAGASDATRGSS